MTTKTILPFLVVVLVGCATPHFPQRPEVAFYVNPEPMYIPQNPVPRPGHKRAIQPAPVPAPLCMSDADHLKLEGYFEQLEAWRGVRLR